MVVRSAEGACSPRITKRIALCLAALAMAAALALTGCSQQSASESASAAASSSAAAQSQASAQAQAPAAVNATVVIMDPDNDGEFSTQEAVALAEGATVLDAIEAANVDFVAEDSSYGKYITTINGKAAEGSSGWVYTVNGQEVMESVDACQLSDGDSVEFKYITM